MADDVPANQNKDEVKTDPAAATDGARTLLEALLVQAVPALLAERERGLARAVHAFVADWAVVLGARDALLLLGGRGGRDGLARRARVGRADVLVRGGVGREGRVCEDVLEFGCQERPVNA